VEVLKTTNKNCDNCFISQVIDFGNEH